MSNRANKQVQIEDIEEKIEEAYSLLDKDAPQLPERLYSALEGISSVILAWRQSDGKPGWAKSLTGKDSKSIFSPEQANKLESALGKWEPYADDLFNPESDVVDIIEESSQIGGASYASFSNVKPGFGSLVQPQFTIKPEDISIDKAYKLITNRLDQYDTQWKEITSNLGIVQGIESRDYRGIIPTPWGVPIPYTILGKSIFPLLSTCLDLIRLALGNPKLDFPVIRILLSLSLAILDLIRGDWQNSILSLSGVLSPTGVLIGLFGKILRNAWLFIAPDLQRQLRDDIWKSSKSMSVGFILWCFTVFSPDFIRLAVNQSFMKMRLLVENFNMKSQMAEQKIQGAATAAGVKVSFPEIPLTMVPNIDDIQNLQVISRIPEVYCSQEFQAILQPILLVPPLRLIVELLNIPTLPEDRAKECATVPQATIAKTVSDMVVPEVEIIPGGPANIAAKTQAVLENPTAAIQKKAQDAINQTIPNIQLPELLNKPSSSSDKKTRKQKKGGGRSRRRTPRNRNH